MGKNTSGNTLIREALPNDAGDIYQIGKACFSDAWRKETVRNDLSGGHSDYFIASVDGRTVGYGCFWFVADEAQLVNIGVLPDFRRKGLAEEILKRGIEEASVRRMQTMFLEVRVSNLAAQALYRKYQFQVVSVRQAVYDLPRENGYIMSRTL